MKNTMLSSNIAARALAGHLFPFELCRSVKDLAPGAMTALLAGLQAGKGAFFHAAELLRDKTLPIAGRARAFGTACTSSALHGSEPLRLNCSGLRRLEGWEGRWLRSMRRFKRRNWEAHQHFLQRTEDALDGIYTRNDTKSAVVPREVLPAQGLLAPQGCARLVGGHLTRCEAHTPAMSGYAQSDGA